MISPEGAARAALEIIDSQGLDALSLDQVARKLGVKAPSLYYHFKDKSALLLEVARTILLDLDLPDTSKMSWEEAQITICIATRRSLLRHPNATLLLLQFFPRHILLAGYEKWIGPCPYPPEIHMMVIEGTEKLTFASALFEAAAISRSVKAMPAFDPDKLPGLARAVATNPHDDESLFRETLKCMLDGFRNYQSSPPSSR